VCKYGIISLGIPVTWARPANQNLNGLDGWRRAEAAALRRLSCRYRTKWKHITRHNLLRHSVSGLSGVRGKKVMLASADSPGWRELGACLV